MVSVLSGIQMLSNSEDQLKIQWIEYVVLPSDISQAVFYIQGSYLIG